MKKSLSQRNSICKHRVIKVGSRILTAGGHEKRVKNLVEDILLLHQTGIRMILVSQELLPTG